MPISIVNIDILDSNADAIILTVDGTKKGMEGNIARAFAKKYPNAWELLGYEVNYPIPLGMTKIYSIEDDDDSNYRFCIIASTLHHLEILERSEKLGIINSALHHALTQAKNKQLKSICTTIWKGGWRLEVEDALAQMISTYKAHLNTNSNAPDLEVCVKDTEEFEKVLEMVKVNYPETDIFDNKLVIS